MVSYVLCGSGGLFHRPLGAPRRVSSMRGGSVIYRGRLVAPDMRQCCSPDPERLEPYTWRENFQGTELGQFASYPPVQDVGYDPSLVPTAEYGAFGGRSLMRILKPVRSGPERFGFIRRLDLVASSSGTLSFAFASRLLLRRSHRGRHRCRERTTLYATRDGGHGRGLAQVRLTGPGATRRIPPSAAERSWH